MKFYIATVMIRDLTSKFALKLKIGACATLLTAGSAMAQQIPVPVSAGIHSSASSCAQCDLSNKRLNGVKFKNSNFAGSSFNNSNLSGGNFDGSNLTGTHFRKALMYRVEGHNVNLNGANLSDATLTEANLSSSIFIGTDFRRTDLTRGKFPDGDFRKTSFERATATDVNFQNTDFSGAKLDHINLHNAKLDGAKFNNVTFGNAILLDASLAGADLSDANMSQAQGLKQEQLDSACGNANTRLPYGLSVPYCEGSLMADARDNHDHASMDPEMAKAALNLDRALSNLEKVILDRSLTEKERLRKLQSAHADVTRSKRIIEK